MFIRLTRSGIQAHTRNIKKINCASLPPCQKFVEKNIQGAQYVVKIWKRCYASDPTDRLEPVNNCWKMIGQNLEPDRYSRTYLPEQLVKDIDTDKAMVVENSDDEWTDESDDDI